MTHTCRLSKFDKCLEYIEADKIRYAGAGGGIFEYQQILRKAHFASSRLMSLYYRWRLKCYREKYGLEIAFEANIGKGLYIGHPFCITINPHAQLGDNCNIHRGVLIGQENRGKRKGAPVIGNKVWIGINSTIVGNIKIGDDVMIAPNSYVNCDVPSHSIVYGNPCVIKHCENATIEYINDVV